jgi:hypothetical protein
MIAGSFLEDVFMSVPGTVMVFSKPMRAGFYAYFVGGYGDVFAAGTSYGYMRSVITNITINENCNFQFMPSLRNMTYLYTFGDKISEIDISGTCFLNAECDGFSGAHAVYAFYYRNKLSNNPNPLSLTLMSFGGMGNMALTFRPFLANMTLGIADPGGVLGTFSYKLYYMPANDSAPLPLSTGTGAGPYVNTPSPVGGITPPTSQSPGYTSPGGADPNAPIATDPYDGATPGSTPGARPASETEAAPYRYYPGPATGLLDTGLAVANSIGEAVKILWVPSSTTSGSGTVPVTPAP